MTPTNSDGRSKSPWRLRFEKFLNHQELTPLSPPDGSIAFTTSKVNGSVFTYANQAIFCLLDIFIE